MKSPGWSANIAFCASGAHVHWVRCAPVLESSVFAAAGRSPKRTV